MATTRILQVCDAWVAALVARWSPTSPDGAQRVYDTNVVLNPDRPDQLEGRQVFIFPRTYRTQARHSRSQDERSYEVSVLVVEVYPGPQPVPTAWVDDRVDFVSSQVWPFLDNVRQGYVVDQVWPEPGAEVQVYDPEKLRELKLFWSWVDAELREVTT